ncbi:methyltransferase [Legionella busanensis]|uniref:Methyltransferase n=1 Tax=Legionella busanensis TaxID=190655 RepID=A0A378JKM3_9GAMM|nr:ergothioneine biosynthesis protein EgtB [Legionella busanensis]STX50670.1 methyltransferase [Legionella busanensis]
MQVSQAIYENEEIFKKELMTSFRSVREKTEKLCQVLITEDYIIQGMPDVSPPKWHLAHTTWFFETFILLKSKYYRPFKKSYDYLFNSYYLGINQPFPRANRGLLSRPSVADIYSYRGHVDKQILELINKSSSNKLNNLYSLMRLGIEHEQQHQELLLMDIKYNFSLHPDLPTYWALETSKSHASETPLEFIDVEEGNFIMGYQGINFCFDNELPYHQHFITNFSIANRLVTNGEYLEFMLAGGYKDPALWLADGWDWIKNNAITKPLYWLDIDNCWYEFTLTGSKLINYCEPVSHISYFEADAYARWRSCRLPTEAEWEYFVTQNQLPLDGNFLEQDFYHPQSAHNQSTDVTAKQFFGDLWEWTSSPYSAYPQYKPFSGLVGEYNGKFMNNQYVLRGGCCISPQEHIRATYRNFYQPEKRWVFSGIRLAKDN